MCLHHVASRNYLALTQIHYVAFNFYTKHTYILTLYNISNQIPDKDLEKRRCEQRVDPLTDILYTKSEYAPDMATNEEQDKDEEDEEEEEEEEAEEEMIEEEEEVQ